MKIFITLSCLVVVSLATPTILDLHSQWAQFKITHKKTYETIEKEQNRFKIFIDNLKEIEEHNKLYEQGLVTYQMGINQFSDLTHEEFVSSMGGRRTKPTKIKPVGGTFVKQLNTHNLPDAFDWRNKSAVTPVKDQGDCPINWAFAVTGALEGLYARKYGKLISLSDQELLNCVKVGKDPIGCNQVSMVDYVYDYVLSNGLTSDDKWPYVGYERGCDIDGNRSRAIYISSYQEVENAYLDENYLVHALVKFGPISVVLNNNGWQHYAKGIFTGDCTSGDSVALIVGYGTENKDQDYWILKNSWGEHWGENGYIRLPRYQNKCDIVSYPVYPVL